MKEINVVVIDDHKMFLQGVSLLLDTIEDITIIGTATSGQEALIHLENKLVDVVLLDINMPEMDGVTLSKIIKKKYPAVKILIVSTYSNVQIVSRLIRIGIDGYVLKNVGKEVLHNAITTIYNGGTYFTKEIAKKEQENKTKLRKNQFYVTDLSKREKEILCLIAKEFTAAEISEHLFISINTVNTHRRNLLSKLNAKNTAGLVKYAVENGLMD